MRESLLDEIRTEELEYIEKNVSDYCDLPAIRKKEMHPILDESLEKFLKAIQTDAHGGLMFVATFTGMRESELMGLTWDCVNFQKKTIRVYRQLSKARGDSAIGQYVFTNLKNKKERTFAAMDAVFDALLRVKEQQLEWRRKCGQAWSNPYGLVFTNEVGRNLPTTTVWKWFKRIAVDVGVEKSRFHDLRHPFTVESLRAGVTGKQSRKCLVTARSVSPWMFTATSQRPCRMKRRTSCKR